MRSKVPDHLNGCEGIETSRFEASRLSACTGANLKHRQGHVRLHQSVGVRSLARQVNGGNNKKFAILSTWHSGNAVLASDPGS